MADEDKPKPSPWNRQYLEERKRTIRKEAIATMMRISSLDLAARQSKKK